MYRVKNVDFPDEVETFQTFHFVMTEKIKQNEEHYAVTKDGRVVCHIKNFTKQIQSLNATNEENDLLETYAKKIDYTFSKLS